jgi:hypothetical protein
MRTREGAQSIGMGFCRKALWTGSDEGCCFGIQLVSFLFFFIFSFFRLCLPFSVTVGLVSVMMMVPPFLPFSTLNSRFRLIYDMEVFTIVP